MIGTIGSVEKRDFLVNEWGMREEEVIVREGGQQQWAEQLGRAGGAAGLDLVLDSLYGPYFAPAFAALKPQGRYVVFGAGDMMTHSDSPGWLSLGWKYFTRPKIDPLDMIASNRALFGFNLIWLMHQTEQFDRLFDTIFHVVNRLWSSPLPVPHVGRTFPFSHALDALRYFQTGRSVGKVVLLVNPSQS